MATPVRTEFELVGADGRPLRGEIRASGNGAGMPAVIISHGFKGFKDWGFFPHIASRLAGAGISVATFNFSGSGVGPDGLTFSEPDRFTGLCHSNQARDLDLVIDSVLSGGLVPGQEPPTTLGLLGYSMGGVASLGRTVRRKEVRSLITWSAISQLVRWDTTTVENWRNRGSLEVVNARTGEVLELGIGFIEDIEENIDQLDPLVHAADLDVPWLIVHCEGDETVSVGEAQSLHEASENAEIRLISGGSHTFGAKHPWGGMTPALDVAFEATVDHFVRSLI
jgi:dienelactone hydrolase